MAKSLIRPNEFTQNVPRLYLIKNIAGDEAAAVCCMLQGRAARAESRFRGPVACYPRSLQNFCLLWSGGGAEMWEMWGEMWELALRRPSKCGNTC
jgi:hypothetical protein